MILSYQTLDDKTIKQRMRLDSRDNKSKLHQSALNIIHDIIPLAQIIEEVPVKIMSNSPTVFFDIYIPINLLFIEIHGQQHYKFVKFMHDTKLAFTKAKIRDNLKKKWCEKNEFQYLELKYNEQDTWKENILSKIY